MMAAPEVYLYPAETEQMILQPAGGKVPLQSEDTVVHDEMMIPSLYRLYNLSVVAYKITS